ncbi:MAG: hypothetical protein LBL34_07095 [Clostridiales bacterium]|jgi:rubrerythrin|nr:hypothetical protein [Clostridiales bacterium]
MIEKNDWRLGILNNRLKGETWAHKKYTQYSESWDRDHCEACTDKFMEREGFLREGYCTLDKNHWICPTCYNDFKNMFGWTLI